MIYTEYETIYVVKPELPEDALGALNEKIQGIISKNEGETLTFDDWGKRKLAYPIQKNSKGHYIYLNFVGPTNLVAELERHLRIEDNLLRFLTVKLGFDVDVESRRAEAIELNAKRAAARPPPAGAPAAPPPRAPPPPAPRPAAPGPPPPPAAAAEAADAAAADDYDDEDDGDDATDGGEA